MEDFGMFLRFFRRFRAMVPQDELREYFAERFNENKCS